MSDHQPPPPSTPAPPQKRRRLSASSTLKKPFRSPLLSRRPEGAPAPASPQFTLPPSTPTSKPASTPSKPPATPGPPTKKTSFTAPTSTASPLLTPRTPRRPLFPTPRPNTPNTLRSNPSSDPLSAAQKEHTGLLTRIRSTKQVQETVSQALSLEANPAGDAALTASIRKWRVIARAAAEALFAIAADKVHALGWGWDEDKRGGGGGGEEEEGDGDEGIGGEDEKAADEAKRNDTEEWGMGLMLKTLGIPEKMLGWDRHADCWVDLEEMDI
ncbi:hypothetical protein BZA05DRAFT_474426 [Tricharina praecox]|uniref:uncharacterized protein n=1 Tax=Tricharina praecox TaxID=43433 RepID=UPI00221E49AE|nr:uncharacterized protein BZA05DRAFT_474426 [Tricharina praecox]KAI5850674.1 hypothetical protein BZA05DRAFT_474426 [Tricharina praecox]